jgi:uracil-DNA glycosylase
VLLLNTCLTVEQGLPASHAGQGWEVLTDAIIQAVLTNDRPVVFMLWGAHAQSLGRRLQGQTGFADAAAGGGRHLVLTANHPSPLSALRPPEPFIGCGHFGRANAFLQQQGQAPVLW